MEEFIRANIDFEDIKLSGLVTTLKCSFDKQQDSFVYLCRDIYNIWSYCKGNYWKAKDNEYYNSYKLLAKFGFDKKAVSRYKQCYEKFIVDNDVTLSLIIPFQNFTPSKLFELLPLSQDTAMELVTNQLITPTMTVKQIREYIKTLKDGMNKAEKVIENITINEEEIPMAYDPKQEYDYSYFETKTKNQLLNIVWELQKAYQKLKLSKEKIKK